MAYYTHMPVAYSYGSKAHTSQAMPTTVAPRPECLEPEMVVNWELIWSFALKNGQDPVATEFALYKAAAQCETMEEAIRIGRHAELAREWIG